MALWIFGLPTIKNLWWKNLYVVKTSVFCEKWWSSAIDSHLFLLRFFHHLNNKKINQQIIKLLNYYFYTLVDWFYIQLETGPASFRKIIFIRYKRKRITIILLRTPLVLLVTLSSFFELLPYHQFNHNFWNSYRAKT